MTYRDLLNILNELKDHELDHKAVIFNSDNGKWFYIIDGGYVLVEDVEDVELGQLYLEIE